MTTMIMVWPATWFTMSCRPAPAYCALKVAPAIASPEPIAMTRNVTGKLTETAATEELVLFEHQPLRADAGIRGREPVVPDQRHPLDEWP